MRPSLPQGWCTESSCAYPGRSAQRAVRAARGGGLRPTSKGVEAPPNPKGTRSARGTATSAVSGQKPVLSLAKGQQRP
jgi:hypothetical protein